MTNDFQGEKTFLLHSIQKMYFASTLPSTVLDIEKIKVKLSVKYKTTIAIAMHTLSLNHF